MNLANYEAEQALLAAILHTNGIYHRVAGILHPEDFADALHGRIFEAIGRLVHKGFTASPPTLKDHFAHDPAILGSPNPEYLRMLAASVITVIGAEDFAVTIRDLSDRRKIIAIAEDAITAAENVDLDKPASQVAADMASDLARSIAQEKDLDSAGDMAERVVDALKSDLVCYPTGLSCIDQTIGGGLFPGKLYGLPARMKAGKTMLATTISYNLDCAGVPHAYIPLEMGAEEITMRMLAKEMRCNSLAFLDPIKRQSAGFIAAAGSAALRVRARGSLLFQGHPRMAMDDIRQTIARAALVHGVKGVIVDYLQLVTGQRKGENSAQHLDNVTQMLAEMAKRYNVWILAAAQLNQEGNVRGGEGLLNACDMTLCLHRVESVSGPAMAWLEMMATRFTPKTDIGSAVSPALMIDTKAGPMFVETGYVGQEIAA